MFVIIIIISSIITTITYYSIVIIGTFRVPTSTCEKDTPFAQAFALQSSSKNCSPAPDLVLWKLILQCVFSRRSVFLTDASVGRLSYFCLRVFCCLTRSSRNSPDFQQNFTGISPEFHQKSPDFTRISNRSSLKEGITTTQPSHRHRYRASWRALQEGDETCWLSLSLLRFVDSESPGNSLWTWDFHLLRIRLCLSQTFWNPSY